MAETTETTYGWADRNSEWEYLCVSHRPEMESLYLFREVTVRVEAAAYECRECGIALLLAWTARTHAAENPTPDPQEEEQVNPTLGWAHGDGTTNRCLYHEPSILSSDNPWVVVRYPEDAKNRPCTFPKCGRSLWDVAVEADGAQEPETEPAPVIGWTTGSAIIRCLEHPFTMSGRGREIPLGDALESRECTYYRCNEVLKDVYFRQQTGARPIELEDAAPAPEPQHIGYRSIDHVRFRCLEHPFKRLSFAKVFDHEGYGDNVCDRIGCGQTLVSAPTPEPSPPETLPPFSGLESRCVKCTGDDIEARYAAPTLGLGAPGERLNRVCLECGYSWPELCADASPPVAGAGMVGEPVIVAGAGTKETWGEFIGNLAGMEMSAPMRVTDVEPVVGYRHKVRGHVWYVEHKPVFTRDQYEAVTAVELPDGTTCNRCSVGGHACGKDVTAPQQAEKECFHVLAYSDAGQHRECIHCGMGEDRPASGWTPEDTYEIWYRGQKVKLAPGSVQCEECGDVMPQRQHAAHVAWHGVARSDA